jgi:hypothetical protein
MAYRIISNTGFAECLLINYKYDTNYLESNIEGTTGLVVRQPEGVLYRLHPREFLNPKP